MPTENETQSRYRYIAIEGPIGVGKSSLARLLSKRFSANVALEASEENPFLEKFYRDSKLCTIGEGTSEIQRLVISRGILGR